MLIDNISNTTEAGIMARNQCREIDAQYAYLIESASSNPNMCLEDRMAYEQDLLLKRAEAQARCTQIIASVWLWK